jgi:hypothetical protein
MAAGLYTDFDRQSQLLIVRWLIVKPIWVKRAAPMQVI